MLLAICMLLAVACCLLWHAVSCSMLLADDISCIMLLAVAYPGIILATYWPSINGYNLTVTQACTIHWLILTHLPLFVDFFVPFCVSLRVFHVLTKPIPAVKMQEKQGNVVGCTRN